MSRKISVITLQDCGRDSGKVFQLTEMSAKRGFSWALRALLSIGKSGINMPDNLKDMGLAGIARMGIETLFKIDPVEAEPLLEELLGCVMYLPDPKKPNIIRHLIDDDIEEIMTRFKLVKEVFSLHVSFLDSESDTG
jgi:hypothetical protein